MDTSTFLELTESALLTEIGERLRSFFDQTATEYVPYSLDGIRDGLFEKVEKQNPRSAIYPVAQINMIANVTFHLMAQQLAILFHERPNVDRQKVYDTAFDNIKKLTLQYLKDIQEGKDNDKTDG